MLAKLAWKNQTEWDSHLAPIAMAIRTMTCEPLRATPAFLNFGRELNTAASVLAPRLAPVTQLEAEDDTPSSFAMKLQANLIHAHTIAHEAVRLAREQQKRYYDARHQDSALCVGNLVLRRTHARSSASDNFAKKLAPRWDGPHQILREITPVTFEIENLAHKGNKTICHATDLRTYDIRRVHNDEGEPFDEHDLLLNNTSNTCAAASCNFPQATHWVQCDGPCDNWFHNVCVGYPDSLFAGDVFICPSCEMSEVAHDDSQLNATSEHDMHETHVNDSQDHSDSHTDEETEQSSPAARPLGLRDRRFLRLPSRLRDISDNALLVFIT